VALVAVGSAMIPSQSAHTVWLLYVPIVLFGGWWLRRRRRPLSDRTRRRWPASAVCRNEPPEAPDGGI